VSVTTGLSAEEYLARDFPPRTQLIRGEVVVNEPIIRHQRVAQFLFRRLADWVDASANRGEAGLGSDWVVGERDVFAPDVWWLRESRRPGRDAPRIHGAPDLVVEVRSPSTWRYDVGPKRGTYERSGVLELWLVDLEADSVIVNRRSAPDAPGFDVLLELGTGEVVTSALFPGLEISVDELFDR